MDLGAGARATSWTVGRHSLLAQHGPDPVEYGMYPMAPWAGRLRENTLIVGDVRHRLPRSYGGWAIHGTVYDSALELVEVEHVDGQSRLLARATQHPAWPWPMTVDVEWRVSGRVVTTVIAVHALDRPFPAVVGWHPWFRRRLGSGGDLEWSLPATLLAERGRDHLPTGRLLACDTTLGPFDDAFVVPSGTASVRWPGALSIDIDADSSWFVVLTEMPDAVCIEPQSGPPNGVNDGLGGTIPIAAPGRPHVLTTTWTVRDDPPEGPT